MNRDTDSLPHQQRRARRPASNRQLRRAKEDRLLGGVLGGIAQFVGADPRWVRGLYLAALALSLGFMVIPYLVLWWLLPAPE